MFAPSQQARVGFWLMPRDIRDIEEVVEWLIRHSRTCKQWSRGVIGDCTCCALLVELRRKIPPKGA